MTSETFSQAAQEPQSRNADWEKGKGEPAKETAWLLPHLIMLCCITWNYNALCIMDNLNTGLQSKISFYKTNVQKSPWKQEKGTLRDNSGKLSWYFRQFS